MAKKELDLMAILEGKVANIVIAEPNYYDQKNNLIQKY